MTRLLLGLALTGALGAGIGVATGFAGGAAPQAPCNAAAYNLQGNRVNASMCATFFQSNSLNTGWVFSDSGGNTVSSTCGVGGCIALAATTSSPGAVGVDAVATGGGTALKVSGKSSFTGATSFSRSGVLTAPGGTNHVQKTGIALTSSSYVLATLQTNTPGVWVRAAVPDTASNTITVYFNTNAPAGAKVAWFVVN